MCMFDVFCRIAQEWNLNLYPVHVNHKFRPGAAEADQEFVETYCEAAGWPCRTFVRDCNAVAAAEGLTPEEAGRKVRYEAFVEVAEELAAQSVSPHHIAIAVGQNADDQAETVLFRLLRGTGVDGLAGIAYKRWEHGFAVIRPLLDCSRQEIEAYCTEQNLQPRRDHTNEEPVYMRNRIRLQLLPLLREEYNSNINAGLNRLAASAAMDSDYLWRQAEEVYGQAMAAETGSSVELSMEVLDSLHPAIRIRLYNKALGQIGLKENISAAHLDGVEAVRISSSPSARWNLPEPYVAEKRYDRLCFFKVSNSVENGQLQVTLRQSAIGDTMAGGDRCGCMCGDACGDAGADAGLAKHTRTAQFDAQTLMDVYGDDACEKIVLRTRQTGDFMTIFTSGGLHRKKLQDILVDMKVPKHLRDQVKLAAIGSEILWILPGDGRNGRVSSAYKIVENEDRTRIVLEYLFQI